MRHLQPAGPSNSASAGNTGSKGPDGPDGTSGSSGTDIVPVSELELIPAALATHPSLRLEAEGGGAPRKKRAAR